MAAPTPSKLDHQQVLQGSFDESTGRLRVDAQLSSTIIAPPGLEVSIDAIDDNIAIRNSNNSHELLINADGSINTNATLVGTSNVNLLQVGGSSITLSQKVMASSIPVVLASNQSSIPVSQSGSWTVSITPESIEIGTVDQGTPNTLGNAWPVKPTDGVNSQSYTASGESKVLVTPLTNSSIVKAQLQDNAGNGLTSQVSGSQRALDIGINVAGVQVDPRTRIWTLSSGTDSVSATQSGVWTTGRTWTLSNGTDSVNVGNFPATQAVTQSTSPWVSNITQFGSNNVVTGTGASGLGIPRVTVSNDSNILATQSGTWNIGTLTTITNPVTVSQSTAANLNATVVGTGTFAVQAAQSGTWNINNITGTVSLPTGAATEATLAEINVGIEELTQSQGSTTSGQVGPLIQGAVTTNAPTYVTGNTNPLSLDTSGLLRVSLKDTPANTNKFLITADPITFASPQHVILDSGTLTSITNTVTIAGTVTSNQGTSPWVKNVSQFGGSNVVTGTGASGVGIPRVTVSNDSNILATQSGTWNINNITGTVSLPTGASTSANQTNGTQKSQIVDGSNATVGPVTTISAINYLPVIQASSGTPGAAVPARSTVVAGSDGTNVQTLSTDTTGKLNINNISGTVSLPTLAATSTKQSDGSQKTQIVDGGGVVIATNYGTAANALRVAAQIGNASAVADFNAGTSGAQTLRVSSNITRNGTELSYNAGTSDANTLRAAVNLKREGTDLDYNFGTVGANTLRSAAQIGNATGAADFNAGSATAQTLRVTASNLPTTADTNYGTVGASTLRTASQIGNATGAADFNAGAITAQTLRVASVPLDGSKSTYLATATFTAAATPTDIFTITGSATKTVRIIRVGISATQTTASEVNLSLVKRSTANTGGGINSPTIVPIDSNNAAATATVINYTTTNPTTGNLVGNLRNVKLIVNVTSVAAGASAQTELIESFGDRFGQALVLRGTSQVFAVNLNGVTITGNSFSIWIEWTEE